jgi:predicted Rossmann fold nucleotide-binding protein DprA/Smf involved in DNA uptake
MQMERLSHDHPEFPHYLARYLGERTPSSIYVLGDLAILRSCTLAWFCSVKCPGDLILKTFDLARALREAQIPVIGGFHSPMEKECLKLLLRGQQPVIICPARSIWSRLPEEWKLPIAQGRLLIVSPFAEKHRHPTAELAQERNEFVAALADNIFVAYASPGSKTERFCQTVISWEKPLFTLESQDNATLIALGARPVTPKTLTARLSKFGN